MKCTSIFRKCLVLPVLFTMFFSCQKKGDFINEDKTGEGMHYYPTILNKSFTDTATKKNLKDLKAKPGQQVSFELRFRSKDSIDRVELWEKVKKNTQKVEEVTYNSSFYSDIQHCDTLFLSYQIPQNKDSTAYTLTLIPKVISKRGLTKEKLIEMEVKKK